MRAFQSVHGVRGDHINHFYGQEEKNTGQKIEDI